MSNNLYVDKKNVGLIPEFDIQLPKIMKITVSTEFFEKTFTVDNVAFGSPVFMKGQTVGTIEVYSPAQVSLYIIPEFFEFSVMKPVPITMRYVGPEPVEPVVPDEDLIDQLLGVPDTALARDF